MHLLVENGSETCKNNKRIMMNCNQMNISKPYMVYRVVHVVFGRILSLTTFGE